MASTPEIVPSNAQCGGQPSRRERINYRLQALSDLQAALYPIVDLIAEQGKTAPDGKPILLLGDWGTGKTHFVCDFALAALNNKIPAVAVRAPALDGGSPLDKLAQALGIADADSMWDLLDNAAATLGRRALISIDAVNEGDRAERERPLPQLLRAIDARQNVALVLTCRTRFDRQIADGSVRKRVQVVYHPGFGDQKFDAQLEFFDFYKLPALHVPLLAAEFARPLFLKLLCEGLVRLSKRTQKRHLEGISSGQRVPAESARRRRRGTCQASRLLRQLCDVDARGRRGARFL